MQNTNTPTPPKPQDIYDLTGQAFGETTVVKLDHITKGRRYWLTRHVCGSERILPAHEFRAKEIHCDTCETNQLIASEKATPEWLIKLGFDVTFMSRFWPHVKRPGPLPKHCPELGPCWVWTAGVNGNGYGSIAMRCLPKVVQISTHRAGWIIHNQKPVPQGDGVLHHCDTPRCVRGAHLFTGDNAKNTEDMIRKGRDRKVFGEAHHQAVLTDSQVIEIRRLYATGNYTYKELAGIFHCAPSTIAWIVRGDYWRHLL